MLSRLAALGLAAALMAVAYLTWPRNIDVAVPQSYSAADPAQITHGAWLAKAGGCKGCHTTPGGDAYAGGRALETPFGTFYSPNLTPDETGLKAWTEQDFVRAVRHGIRADGQALYPTFPYASYAKMTDGDALALYAYFQSLPPIAKDVPAHDVPLPFAWRAVLNGWRTLFLDTTPLDPAADRGRYLVEALGHCGECHTPRTPLGNLDHARKFEGTKNGPEGEEVPAITAAALGDWTADDIAELLSSGFKPDYDNVQGSMEEVVGESTSHLSDADRLFIGEYLLRP